MKSHNHDFVQFRVIMIAAIVLSSACTLFAQKEYSIAEIQGEKNISPHDKEAVRVTGIVTAVVKNGFYIQTPDAQVDNNPKTSEGLYIYGRDSAGLVSIGDLVQVDGTVTEYRPANEKIFLSITEITRPTVKVISKDNPVPAPIVLTSVELDPKGKLDQMERFEGMRVRADFTVVGPTGGFKNEKTGVATSNGVFFVALHNTPRPFREAGIEVLTVISEKMPETTPYFDMNPEMLRVDSVAQVGNKPLDVPAGTTIKNLTGIIDYSRKFYTLVIDAKDPSEIENIKGFVPLSPAGNREVTVGSFNVENFFDDENNSSNIAKETIVTKELFQNRLKKASLAIRNVLSLPDVLGIVEIENLKVLQKLADRINADVAAAGQPSPKYMAYLADGNDVRGINVGFLVKSTKIKVIETKQLGKDAKLDFPAAFPNEKLFDRPPFMLRAEVIDSQSQKPLEFSTIVNHIKSYRGIDDVKDGNRVRNKRRLQAEWLANFVQERQKADSTERLILCGDFNAFQFNDGYNDLIGILRGKPEPNVITPSKTLYNTGLINLIDFIDAKNRYSYTFDGSAQALDHILVNKPTRDRLLKFGYARVAADFPLVWSNDVNRPERLSDHDAPVVFLSLDEPAAAKTPPQP